MGTEVERPNQSSELKLPELILLWNKFAQNNRQEPIKREDLICVAPYTVVFQIFEPALINHPNLSSVKNMRNLLSKYWSVLEKLIC